MKVLIACEFSGAVREAFRSLGHDAWSCDLLPSELPGKHIWGDVLKVLDAGWDLVIAHPPCTALAASGARWFESKRRDGTQDAAVSFFLSFVDCARTPRVHHMAPGPNRWRERSRTYSGLANAMASQWGAL